jgi:hypothetical protein
MVRDRNNHICIAERADKAKITFGSVTGFILEGHTDATNA